MHILDNQRQNNKNSQNMDIKKMARWSQNYCRKMKITKSEILKSFMVE